MIARPPLAVPLFALAGFLVLLGLVVGGWAPLDHADTVVSDTLREYGQARPGLVAVLRVATDVATTVTFLSAGLVASLLLLTQGGRRQAAFCVAVTAVVPVAWSLMHWLLHHPRPSDGFVVISSNGFPSGHTANGTSAALVVVLLFWPRLGATARVVTLGMATVFALFVGATRVALLAHWPADVLGGWLLALAVVPLAARAVARSQPTGMAADPSRGSSAASGSR